jgi:acyl carrier protein
MTTNEVRTATEIQDWIVRWLSKELKVPEDRLSPSQPFVNLGMSSRQAVMLSGDLEDWLGRELDPALVWDHPTIQALATHLAAA